MSSIKENNLGLNYGWEYGERGWNSGMDEIEQRLSVLESKA